LIYLENPNRKSSIGNRQLFPAGLGKEMFEENGAGDGGAGFTLSSTDKVSPAFR